MFRFFTPGFAIIVICLLLASCATVEQQPVEDIVVEKEKAVIEPAGWQAEQQQRQQIRVWEIRGRLGVQTETNGGSMDIIWKQSNEDYSIHLIPPLGAGSYLIQGNSQFAEIRYPDGHKALINNIDEAFSSALEIDLPANVVKDWIRGLPAASLSIESIKWNEQGLLNRIEQSGWNVEMKKYTGTSILLPHLVYLSHDDNEALDVRLALRQWMLDN
jgi:outer membrane lipoprotein LolB